MAANPADDPPAECQLQPFLPAAGATLSKYDPQTNILWLKLTDASSNTSWFPIHLHQFPQSVDYSGAA
jgi:hypothetical protein